MLIAYITNFDVIVELLKDSHFSTQILFTSATPNRLPEQYFAASWYRKNSSPFNFDIHNLNSAWASRQGIYFRISQKISLNQCEMRCSMLKNNNSLELN